MICITEKPSELVRGVVRTGVSGVRTGAWGRTDWCVGRANWCVGSGGLVWRADGLGSDGVARGFGWGRAGVRMGARGGSTQSSPVLFFGLPSGRMSCRPRSENQNLTVCAFRSTEPTRMASADAASSLCRTRRSRIRGCHSRHNCVCGARLFVRVESRDHDEEI